MSSSIKDALLASCQGSMIIAEVNLERSRKIAERQAIGERIRTLKDLVHQTFVSIPKSMNRAVRFDVYTNSKERIRELGQIGGHEYELVIRSLQYAHTSKHAFHEAIEMLSDESDHSFNDYDSSDYSSRRVCNYIPE